MLILYTNCWLRIWTKLPQVFAHSIIQAWKLQHFPTLELKYDLYKVTFSKDLHGSLAAEQHMTKKHQQDLN